MKLIQHPLPLDELDRHSLKGDGGGRDGERVKQPAELLLSGKRKPLYLEKVQRLFRSRSLCPHRLKEGPSS